MKLFSYLGHILRKAHYWLHDNFVILFEFYGFIVYIYFAREIPLQNTVIVKREKKITLHSAFQALHFGSKNRVDL